MVVPGPGISVAGWISPFKNGVTTYPATQPGGSECAGAQLTTADAFPGADDGIVGAVSVDAQSPGNELSVENSATSTP